VIPPTEPPSAQSLLKMLPFELIRLKRHLLHGPPHETINALSVVSDLRLARHVREAIWGCCEHSDPKVRSKAVLMLGDLLVEGKDDEADRLLAEALVDADDRVRANAVEVLERTQNQQLASLLEARSRLGRNRERANAIKAMASMRLCDPEKPLFEMLRDRRDPHRLSALWAVEQTGQWKLLEEIARLARHDSNVRVRGAAEATVQRMARKMSRPSRQAA
jgi:HEAT repeat protein